MFDYENLRKPEHLKDDIWRQHLYWVDVMSRQVDENFARHAARVREDAERNRRRRAAARGDRPSNRTRGLFTRR